MADDLGKEVQVATPEPVTVSPELRTKFTEAAKLGLQLANIDQDRRSSGYSSFRDSPVLSDFFGRLKTVSDSELSDTKITEARKASFGFTLEGARQIGKGEWIRPQGLRDDTESLGALIRNVTESSTLAKQLRETDPEGFYQAARTVFAAELGKPIEELVLDGDNLAKLVDETYSAARGRLVRQADALHAYLGR